MHKNNNYIYDTLNEGVLDWGIKFTNHIIDVLKTGYRKKAIEATLKDPILLKSIDELNATLSDIYKQMNKYSDSELKNLEKIIKNGK